MKLLIILFFIFLNYSSHAKTEGSKIIPEGRFAPLYGIEKDQKDFLIKSFRMDIYPVTVNAFNDFLKKNPDWTREKIARIYADKNYLAIKNTVGDSPVVFVSWFAANAYCELKKGRIPSTLEWEYVAAASETLRDASKSAPVIDKILSWYSSPAKDGEILVVGKDKANIYGIHDLHGLIWEWTSDFNSVIMTSDNRDDGDKSKGLYCGAGSIGARTREDYAGFARYSLRSSLSANFTLTNMGFRCAYDL
ncbi:MAG: formylglycine-generating enzyme family protein [Bacteriovorax sp.]|nr:formylglycine-generating enzyme family protein [Bacteriovorax sp.]